MFPDWQVLSPTFDYKDPAGVQKKLDSLVRTQRVNAVMGTSLGGFFAIYCAKKHKLPAMIINRQTEELRHQGGVPVHRRRPRQVRRLRAQGLRQAPLRRHPSPFRPLDRRRAPRRPPLPRREIPEMPRFQLLRPTGAPVCRGEDSETDHREDDGDLILHERLRHHPLFRRHPHEIHAGGEGRDVDSDW